MRNKFLSFVFPETTKKQIDAMPTAEMKLKFYEAVTNYGMYGVEPEDLSEIELLIWIPMKDLISNCKTSTAGAPEGNKNASKTIKNNQNNQNNQNNIVFNETNETNETILSNHNHNHNVNHNDNDKGEGNHNDNEPENPPSPSSGYAELQQNVYKKIQEHNKTVPVESKIPVSSSLLTFVQKEFRELLDVMRGSPPEEIMQTVENLLKAAKERRKSRYSWWFFLKDINEYRPEYFQEKTGRPSDMSSDDFFNLMKDKPGFNMVLFCTHEQDWIKAGKPFDNAYFELQRTWEG